MSQVALNLQIRPAKMDDIAPVVELFNAYSRWLVGHNQHDVEGITNEWQNSPGFDLARDTQVVFDPQGRPVGYLEFWDMGEPHVKFNVWGMVLPEYHHQGIGTYLMEWADQRARQALALARQDARVVLQTGVMSTNETAKALLTNRGFQHIRSFYRMRIDFNGPVAEPNLPDGVTIRSIAPGEERIAMRCIYDSFHDHWGFVEEPFEQYAARWESFLKNDPHHDPALWFLALQGTQVLGASLCYDHLTEDPDLAWVGSLGVRKEQRRMGLGLALLQHSFAQFQRRGKPRAGLGVDASSLTGATRLYERAGMYVYRTYHTYEMELRPGIDLTTQTVNH
jgi:mycothiol synthase